MLPRRLFVQVTLESQHEAVYQLAVEVAKIVPQYCSAAVSSNDVVDILAGVFL
jgi:hypothetical protein